MPCRPTWTPRLLVLPLVLSGCGGSWYEPPGALLGANAAAIPVFHRDVFDILYSTLTGKDCSVVRLDEGKTYCRRPEPPPAPPPYCTASLGRADCWDLLPGFVPRGLPPQLADGPSALSPAQEADRVRAWPPL